MKISTIETTDEGKLPVVVYTEEAFKKMQLFMKSVHSNTLEFMFVGSVRTKDNYYIIDDFYLPPNKSCSGAYCESGDKYDEWFFKTFKTVEEKKSIRAHVHSHVNMKAFPSGTDSNQIMDLYKAVSNYYIQIIINKKFENYVAIYKDGIRYEEVPQLVQINDMVFEYISGEKAVPLCDLADGDYRIKDGMIYIDDNTSYDIYKGDWKVDAGELHYENGAIKYIPKAEVLGECNKLFTEMIEKPATGYGSYGGYGSSYGSGYRDYRSYGNEKAPNNQQSPLPPKADKIIETGSKNNNAGVNMTDPFLALDERDSAAVYKYLAEQGVVD